MVSSRIYGCCFCDNAFLFLEKMAIKIVAISEGGDVILEVTGEDCDLDDEEVINVRLENAKKELQRKDDYDYCITNDDLENAYSKLRQIVKKILEE